MGRKQAREGTMQLLYQMELTDDFSSEVLKLYLENYDYDENETAYIEDSIETIKENLEVIDKYIEENIHGWTINRLANVDLAVLRIAVYEMLYRDDIPIEVSINEAIEIVKKYSNEDSYKFINGVLGGVVKSIEEEKEE